MKEKISAFMDGELERHAEGAVFEQIAREGDALQTWRAYHLISDAMRDTRLLSGDFVARVSAQLAQEPTVLAPGALPPRRENARWVALSAAASVAAVALVGWLALTPPPGGGFGPTIPLAQQQAPKPPVAEPAAAQATQAAQPVLVPPPSEAEDYLLAHHSHSPRGPLQGMVPFVRNVAAPVPAGRP